MLRKLVACFLLLVCPLLCVPQWQSIAQDSAESQRERLTADRFLQVLLRRPRPGTALDRVYGYHVQAGTLDTLQSELVADAGATEDAGARWMLLGLLQLQRGNDADAAVSLAKAEELRSSDAMASYYLGKALVLVGRTDAAASALQRAIDRKPERSEALPVFTELGRLYGRSQQQDKALSVWKQLEDMFPGDTRVGEQIARTLAEEGQDEAALQRYESLATASTASDDFRVVGYRIAAAEIKRRIGRGDEALKDFESLLSRLRPSSWLYADVRRRIEAGFLRTGDYAALADYYAKQVEQQPDEIELRLRLGQTLSKAGRLNEAEAALRAASELAPENADVRLSLIDIFKAAGKPTDAAAQWETLIQQDSQNPDYYVRLGNVYLDDTSLEKVARFKKAAQAWQRLADLRKDDAVVVAQVADLMRRVDYQTESIALYRRAIELAPDQPQYREYLGEYLFRLDRKDEALATWAAIAEAERANRDNLIRLAEVLDTFGYHDKALDAFTKAAELDPTFAHRLRFAELLSRADQYDRSLSQLDLAETIAETFEEYEQLLRARIGVYASSGTLDARIAEAAEKAKQTQQAEDYRKLALMNDAAARVVNATQAIEAALQLDPGNTASLGVAAELYRKASRYGDAVTTYRSLAKLDTRFTPSYLKQIASLQMQLGQVDDAMATAEELISAQPGNPESYRLYAEQCFQLGRDDEGIEKLRRALQTSPRDQEAKRALATALADRFRTDEAIELNWQLLEEADGSSAKSGIVASLATLYERKGDFSRLIDRLELRGREASDMREAILLIAAAHKATGDLGSARQSLEPLLAQNPRDAELLQQMVALSEAADDPDAALVYQQQLVALADTPENRSRLLTLLVDSGRVDVAEASLQRLQAIDEPVTMIGMIDRTLKRGETEAAIRFCRTVLERRSDLWEVRVRLAGMLMTQDKIEESLAEADRIEALPLDPDTKSELAKDRLSKIGQRPGTPVTSGAQTRPTRSSRLVSDYQFYQLGSLFKVGRYANAYSSTSGAPYAVNDVRHAKTLMMALRMIASIKQNKLDEFIKARIDEQTLKTTTDVERLWAAKDVMLLRELFAAPPRTSPSPVAANQPLNDLMWRLAELDETERTAIVSNLLMSRLQQRRPRGLTGAEVKSVEPLTDGQLQLALDAFRTASSPTSNQTELYLGATLYQELVAGQREQDANEIRAKYTTSPTTFADVISATTFFTLIDSASDLTAVVNHVCDHFPELSKTATSNDLTMVSQGYLTSMSPASLSNESKQKLTDLTLACETLRNSKLTLSRRSSMRTGEAYVSYQSGQGYQSKNVPVPFSPRLLSDALVQRVYQWMKFGEESEERTRWVEHLGKDVALLSGDPALAAQERKQRQVLYAFARWWLGDLEGAADALKLASNQAPEDNDLWIERARLAAELNRPEAALDALDAIHPVDQSTLQVREMAAMNLASRLGKLERAKTAAQRLFGMRLDQSVELALADQLSRLGMKDMARAVLQRTQQRGGQTVSNLLDIANRYVASGDNEAAAEVAYGALRKLSSGNDPNGTYYRQQVVRLLTTTKRLDGLLKQAEQRVESAPRSMTLKMELAELYTAAGRKDDADKVFEQVAAEQPGDPKTLWTAAERLSAAGKHDEAVDKFLAAMDKDPGLMRQGYYRFEQAVSQAKASDKAYEKLSEMDLNRFDSYVLGNLAGLYRRQSREPSESARKFLDHLLRNTPPEALGSVLRSVASDKAILGSEVMRDTVVRVFSDAEIYRSDAMIWQSNARSSGGRIFGPLEACLDTIKGSPELQARVRELVSPHAEGEHATAMAKMILIAMDADLSHDANEIAARVKSVLDNKDDPGNYQAWWQLGQRFETKPGLENLAVEILESVRDNDDGRSSSGYEYSIGAKLADAYVHANQKEKATAELLRGYAAINADDQNRSNPGYGDYQAIQSSQSIAQKLQKVDAKLDAIRVYSELLAKPERFEAAKRWGGSSNTMDVVEKEFATLIDSLSEDDFEKFLTFKPSLSAAEGSKQPQPLSFDLIPIKTITASAVDHGSIASLVVSRLSKTEAGKSKLTDFQKQANERLQSAPEDWSLAAMRTLIAVALDQPDADQELASLTAQIAAMGSASEPMTVRANRFMSAFQPVHAGLVSENPTLNSRAVESAKTLVARAQALECNEVSRTISMALLRSGGSGIDPVEVAKTMQAMLDAVAPVSEPPKVLTSTVAAECIKVAEIAAQAGAWPIAMEAVRRGFAGGPPLRVVEATASSGGAFIAQARSSLNSGTNPAGDAADLADYAKRIVKMLSALDADAPQPMSPADAKLAYDALVQIVLPASRPKEVFPYLTAPAVFGLDSPSPSQSPELQPVSVSRSLAECAARSGQSAELVDLINRRMAASQSPETLLLLLVQNALALEDWAAAEPLLQQLAVAVGVLPGDQSAGSSPSQADSAGLQTKVQVLLHAVLPAHGHEELETPVSALQMWLIEQASRDQTISNSGQIWNWMTRQILANPAIDDRRAASVLDHYLSSVRLRYSNYSGSYGEDRYKAESAEFGKVGLASSRYSVAEKPLRTIALRASEFNSAAGAVSRLAQQLMSVNEADRYPLLLKTTFGEQDDDPIAFAGDLVLYVKPPDSLASVTPSLELAQRIPVGDTEFPVVTTMLMLIDTAVQMKRVDDVIGRLQKHTQSPGDEFEAMIGLALLADGRLEATRPILERVVKTLGDTQPTTSVLTPMPIHSALLAARALEHESLRESAAIAWSHLLTHARRRNLGLAASFVNRMVTLSGNDKAAGAQRGSPLKHFISVELPFVSKPQVSSTEALFVIKDGTLRYAGGSDQTVLMFKYPLMGNFSFGHRNVRHGWGESHSVYGGVAYQSTGSKNAATITGLVGRQSVDLPNNAYSDKTDNRYDIEIQDEAVLMKVNGQAIAKDERSYSHPFVGLFFKSHVIAEVGDLQIQGSPAIPREVSLIESQLRGWSCPILSGLLPSTRLPLTPEQNPDEVKALREREESEQKGRTSWYVGNQELLSGDRSAEFNPGGQRHIQYLRPLLDKESLVYDFQYQAGKLEVHPTVGRIAVLLRPTGVKLRWLPQAQSLESTDIDPLHEVDPLEMLGDGKPEFKEGAWNQVKLTADGDSVLVAVNGKAVCRVATSLDRRFGLLGEQDRACQIANAKLIGPWPTEFPENLMEPE